MPAELSSSPASRLLGSGEVLERERLYVLALRTKPAVNALVFHQAAELFNQQFPNLQVRAERRRPRSKYTPYLLSSVKKLSSILPIRGVKVSQTHFSVYT